MFTPTMLSDFPLTFTVDFHTGAIYGNVQGFTPG
jgi:hypothetical protein